jgi:signal transduction histidine kinase
MNATVNEADYPFLADWFAISLRWISLLGLTAAVAASGKLTIASGVVLLLSVLWNIGITILASLNRRLKAHRIINVLLDFLISLSLFIITGGIESPIFWSGVLVFFSAAVYYEWRGSLIVALILSLCQIGWSYYSFGTNIEFIKFLLPELFNLPVSILFGLLGGKLVSFLRGNWQRQIRTRSETERRVAKKERDRLNAFYNMVEALSTTLNYHAVLDAALDLSSKSLGIDETTSGPILSAVMLFEDNYLRIGSARRLPPRDLRLTFPAEQGALHEALKSGEPQVIQNPADDAELCRLVALHSCKVALILPLIRGLNAFGVLLFANPDPDFFNRERSDLLEMISHQVTIAIQNARLYQEMEKEKERIVETQEEARKKLARDLHDGPTQTMAAIAMRLNIVQHAVGPNRKDVTDELEKIEELARHTTQEIRHMLFTLRPLALEAEGLVAALNAMATKMHDTYQQNVKIDVDQSLVDQLEISKQTVVFYLAEEAVNNARKHAKANLINVSLKYLPGEKSLALLEIADNGVGFNLQEVTNSYENRGSLGMVNLSERAELINGVLHIDTAPGKGTRVHIVIPLNEEAADRLERGLAKAQN